MVLDLRGLREELAAKRSVELGVPEERRETKRRGRRKSESKEDGAEGEKGETNVWLRWYDLDMTWKSLLVMMDPLIIARVTL